MSRESITANELIDRLKEAIAVIEAICPGYEVRLLPKNHSPKGSAPTLVNAAIMPSEMPRGGSLREQVVRATATWRSIAEIIRSTGLQQRQIYGVLGAPDTRDRFERRRVGGVKQYRYSGSG